MSSSIKNISPIRPNSASDFEEESLGLAALLRAVADDDRFAFQMLYKRTSKRLLPLAIAVIKHKERAEEALQEAFLIVWLRANRYDPGKGSAFSWLAKVVKNVCLDRLRADRARILMVPLVSDEVDSWQGPFELASQLADVIDVRIGLAKLAACQRAAVSSVFIEGLTHAELAAVSGIPLGTIKTRVRRGLLQLRDVLGEGGGNA